MPLSINLGLPFLEAGQAQKHVTLNEALRILDASIHLCARAVSASAPPSPDEGERHIVAGSGASGAFAGQENALATFEDGAWRFLAPHTGWRSWVESEEILYVFDGEDWRDLRDLSVELDDVSRLGINTVSEGDNRLAVRSNAALLHAVNDADGGSGDVRLQVSKEAAANTASVFFSNAFEGRAEFGLVGSDDFKLKVSANGSDWLEALVVDRATGAVAIPLMADLRGKTLLTGRLTPAQITANANDYAPSGIGAANILRLSTDESRWLTGLQGGEDGRVVVVQNVGSYDLVLKKQSTSSAAANRFALSADVTLGENQCAILQYDAIASRWRSLASPGGASGGSGAADQELLNAQLSLALADALNAAQFFGDKGNRVADSFDATTYVDAGSSTNLSTASAGLLKPTSSASAAYPSSGGLAGLGISATASGLTFAAGAAANLIDGSFANVAFFVAAQSTGSIIFDAGSGNTQYWEAWRWRQDSGANNGTWELSGGPDGSNWTVEHAGAAMSGSTSVETIVTSPAATRYKRLRIVGGTTSSTPFVQEIEAKHSSGAPATNNMTALSAAFTAASAPSAIRAVLRAKFIDAVTLNTDLTVEVSRDGGTTWTAGALVEQFTTPGTSHRVLDTGEISVSGQPSGTSIKWRIKTFNNKSIEIHDAYLRWS